MQTIGDYSSIYEIGAGVNLAVGYVNTFINPVLERSNKELRQFQWWMDNPDRLPKPAVEKSGIEDIEEKLTFWENAYWKLERKVRQERVVPTSVQLTVAVVCLLVLLFPQAKLGVWAGVVGLALVVFPPLVGAAFIWVRTKSEREAERAAAEEAKKSVFPVQSS